MDFLKWAAIGIASAAYAEASSAYAQSSRALSEVRELWGQVEIIGSNIADQIYERAFQKWAEELIYQFNKTVTAIANTPADPVNDYADLVSFIYLIKENNLSTALISGFENKNAFEQALIKSQHILDKLEKNYAVQQYVHRQKALLKQGLLHTQEEERLMAEYGITFDGKQYVYGKYRYNKLSYAVDYVKKEAGHNYRYQKEKTPNLKILKS
jgi:hypothetical protein